MAITKLKRKRASFDEHILDGIEFVDKTTAYEILKSVIPSSIKTSKCPYLPIRQLINFFDPKCGCRRQMKGGAARFCDFINKDKTMSSAITRLNALDTELIALVYGKKNESERGVVINAKWKIDEILKQVSIFMTAFDKSGASYLFRGTESIDGSEDGRRIGICELLIRAYQSSNQIQKFLDKLINLSEKGKDPLSYSVRFK